MLGHASLFVPPQSTLKAILGDHPQSSSSEFLRRVHLLETDRVPTQHQFKRQRYGNDPPAGSPTGTLLRLLLPLAEGHWQGLAAQKGKAPLTARLPMSLSLRHR